MNWSQSEESQNSQDFDDDFQDQHTEDYSEEFSNYWDDGMQPDEPEEQDYSLQQWESHHEPYQSQNQEDQDEQIEYLSPEKIHQYRRLLNELQRKHLRDIYDQAKIRYYKQQFKLNGLVRQIYKYKTYVDARQLFDRLQQYFSKFGCSLCEITIKAYVKDPQSKQTKFEAKINRIQRQIDNILKKYCFKEYAPKQYESTYKSIPIMQTGHQYIHLTLKIPAKNQQIQKELKKDMFKLESAYVKVEDTKWKNKDYLNVSNSSYCNKLKSWDIGCRVRSQNKQFFYPYFEPQGERYMTFSRSMQKEQSEIKQICVYNCLKDSNVVLRTVIKKEQIYLLSYSQDKKDIYVFLSSPPIYQFAVIPSNTYCLPNYLNNWERVQNFLFFKHRIFKDNDFLRLFLYSNSYIHIQLDMNDQKSCQKISIDIDLIQIELNCKKQFVSKNIQISKTMPKALQTVNADLIKTALKFIDIPDKPLMTQHTKWKLSYQIMLLIRFNVMSPGDLQDFLDFAKSNYPRLDLILQYLSKRSAGYTNKVAGMNRCKTNAYSKLKDRLQEFLKEKEKQQQRQRQRQKEKQRRKLKDKENGQVKKEGQENHKQARGSHKKDYFKYSCLIYKVNLTPSGILPNPVSHQTKCRMIREYEDRAQFFLKVTLMDDAGDTMKNQRYIYNKIMRRLLDNVSLLGKPYLPLGWSQSQLKASSIWYVNEIPKDQQKLKKMTQASILQFLGDFSKILIPAKKAARIGQAFSSSYFFDSSKVKQIILNDDLSLKKFLFTDGIGMISKDLFEEVCKNFKKMNIRMNCCLQIRYKGAKGVLLVNDLLQPNTIALRESMVKYECKHPAAQKYLDILSWDKYLPGYLNRQIILLLKSLDIQDKALLQMQRNYVKYLNELDFRELDGNLLKIFNEIDESEDSFMLTITNLKDHFNLQKDLFFQQFLESVKDNKFTQLKKKTRILIQKSARLIGVIDDYKVLEEGQLFCCIKTGMGENIKREVINGDVIITRNPSLSPADVRKCRCLSEDEISQRMKKQGYPSNFFAKFANCIVFPKKGLIPLTAQISGSDLDGDIFFICWEQKFIIKKNQPIETIDDPGKNSPYYYGDAGYKEMLDFFIKFSNNEKLGRINNIHTVIADKSEVFANNSDCKRLAAIHGKAVDYAKSGVEPQEIPQDLIVREYPDFMQKWNKPTYESDSVLGELFRQCKAEMQKRKKNKQKKKLILQADLIEKINYKAVKQSQIKEIISQLKKYEEDVTDLMNHSNLQNQFELYTGSSVENDELKNQFGRKRLADWLKELRDYHQHKFFGGITPLCKKYKLLKSKKLKSKSLFDKKIMDKAILCYVISYFCYCMKDAKESRETLRSMESMRPFCLKVAKIQEELDYEGKFLGFIWVVIPKIIVNMKFIFKK